MPVNEAYFKPFLYRLKNHCQQGITDKGKNIFQTEVKKYCDPAIYANEMALLQTLPLAIGRLAKDSFPIDVFLCIPILVLNVFYNFRLAIGWPLCFNAYREQVAV